METKHQVWEALCHVCEEGITNPVCVSCLEKQLSAWAHDVDSSIVPFVELIISNQHTTGNELTYCIFCEDIMNICAYCVTHEMLALLQMQRPDLVESFISHFGVYPTLERHKVLIGN